MFPQSQRISLLINFALYIDALGSFWPASSLKIAGMNHAASDVNGIPQNIDDGCAFWRRGFEFMALRG